MGFASPWFLGGLVALALPVYFHLLKKHRSTPLPFSSLMFFERRMQSSIQHRRLQYLLLFALRAALLILLVLAFAGPYLTGGPAVSAGGRKLLVLAIDNSFSMRQGGHLDRAKREALQAVAGLAGGDRAQVVAFARQVQIMGELAADQAALRAAVSAIAPSDSRSSYGDLVRALRGVAQSSQLPVEVHLYSDLQKSSMPAGFVELAMPPGSSLKVHAMADQAAPNWAVEAVSAPVRLDDKSKGRVSATLAGFDTAAASLRASLVINGRVTETKSVDVPADGRATVEFSNVDPPHGMNRCEVRIESRDAFPGDDRFLFAMERSEPSRVLFVHESRDTRSPTYFRAALDAAAQAGFFLEARTTWDLSGVSPSRYAFVVLSNVASVPPPFEEALRNHVRQGGSLLVALGASAAARGKVPVLESTLAGSRYASRQGERFLAVDWLDTAHPSIRRANRWEGVQFYQVFPVQAGGNTRVLARVSDQTPVLLEGQVGAGRVLVFASTFDNLANDFPLHSAFVPFVEQTARYLGGMDDSPSSVSVDSYYELRRSSGEGSTVDVLDPDGKRVLDLSETSKALGFSLAREGFYQVRRSNGRHELIAVNADRRESDFEMVPKETISLWQNTGEGAPAAEVSAGTASRLRPVWWHVLLAAFLVALAESVLAARYLSIKKETA
ncbi:MAG: BatA domain-containing protein [Bryobacteraceae bacterium]